jgi:hypothetical protein
MSCATTRRLARLEAKKPARPFRYFQTFEEDDAAVEAWKAALLASGEAVKGDQFMRIRIVDPPPRESDR